jgi:hypothetical protein
MEGVIQFNQSGMFLVRTFTANTPYDEAPVDNFCSQFGDLRADTHIGTIKDQLKEILASISQVVILDKVQHHRGRP